MYGLFDGKNLHFFTGKVQGTIATTPRGTGGFGWDPVFIPRGSNNTAGEMTEREYEQASMRKIALQKLERYLQSR
jgi:XTP/dITP diphosphohydrolase